MPVVTLTHDGCEPWISEHDTDEQADAFAEQWAKNGWSRDTSAPAEQPNVAQAAPEAPAPAPVEVPAPAGPVTPEGV